MQTRTYRMDKQQSLLYDTGSYIQYPMIHHNGEEYEKYIYMYNWITLLYSRNLTQIVNQLYFNKISYTSITIINYTSMVFPVVMYGCESWTIMKAEQQRIDAFELWCWRRLFRVPWTAKRSNQSILKEVNPNIHWKDCGWSWNSNTLAIWCEELTHWKRPWCWESLKAIREGGGRRWDGKIASLTQWTWIWANSGR